ncbi:BlaI/MecI/CopY family transcriptional regulator [Leucobacter sp. wl10]|uniref:BlaI/MecI/CopY family transcriptional regulator n=1 Tax=Leucobacter sp. wl10 TaxID=2304677 RepID=UPI000E5B57FD|nr:BlaI/MecI/CopY family transcriptional regulator [Leucobacter sp. wl10]RGE21462.1 2'-5' RNA ligase [Leucobacter sp. wl10]
MPGVRKREWGGLEGEVMRRLRERDRPVSARELRASFSEPIPAYTTLMTTLTRLEAKGRVERVGDSPRKVSFRPVRSSEEEASETMTSALERASDRRAALLAFAGNLADDDVAALMDAFGSSDHSR